MNPCLSFVAIWHWVILAGQPRDFQGEIGTRRLLSHLKSTPIESHLDNTNDALFTQPTGVLQGYLWWSECSNAGWNQMTWYENDDLGCSTLLSQQAYNSAPPHRHFAQCQFPSPNKCHRGTGRNPVHNRERVWSIPLLSQHLAQFQFPFPGNFRDGPGRKHLLDQQPIKNTAPPLNILFNSKSFLQNTDRI